MGIKIEKSGTRPSLPDSRFVQSIGQAALGEIIHRTKSGVGADDRHFAPYSSDYRMALIKANQQSSVDLWLTGRLLGSIKARIVVASRYLTRVEISASTGPAGKTSLSEGGLNRKGASSTLSLNRLGQILHEGQGKMPARPWLGLPRKVLEQLWHDLWDSRKK